ncbi:MAG TPA: tyrosine-type recombinase/integrase [Solirubrobacteraceae bacterium]|jgi:integrase|nr:tyrosine-type recombinase/integrase [Solirubrobacteraceae bacterium]
MATQEARATSTRAPKGAVVKNPGKDGSYTYALRFTAYGKRQYVTLGRPADGWTDAKAQAELERIIGEVKAGAWTEWTPPAEPEPEPTFHEFASEWFTAHEGEWREATRLDYGWQLTTHLLPYFKDHRLSAITIAEVDRYREGKVTEARAIEAAAANGKPRMRSYTDSNGRRVRKAERPLSPTSINKTITRLGQILEVAVERELIERNPVRVNPRNRKVKASRPDRVYLDRTEQIEALLDAAGQMDREARSNGQIARRALLATLTFAGLRISEALDLRWRDVDLAGARLRVRQSKTDAGIRYVDLLPILHDELATLKARAGTVDRSALVFPSAAGTRQDRNRVRNRVLMPAIKRADERLEAAGAAPLPEGLTLHALRRTFISVLIGLGKDPAYVMAQAGHTDPAITIGIYSKPMRPEDGERLRALVDGGELALEHDNAAHAARK